MPASSCLSASQQKYEARLTERKTKKGSETETRRAESGEQSRERERERERKRDRLRMWGPLSLPSKVMSHTDEAY